MHNPAATWLAVIHAFIHLNPLTQTCFTTRLLNMSGNPEVTRWKVNRNNTGMDRAGWRGGQCVRVTEIWLKTSPTAKANNPHPLLPALPAEDSLTGSKHRPSLRMSSLCCQGLGLHDHRFHLMSGLSAGHDTHICMHTPSYKSFLLHWQQWNILQEKKKKKVPFFFHYIEIFGLNFSTRATANYSVFEN